MDMIFKVLLELIFDGIIELSKNKNVPKIIRVILIAFISLLIIGVVLLVFVTGMLVYQKINKFLGVFLVGCGMILTISFILKFINCVEKGKMN